MMHLWLSCKGLLVSQLPTVAVGTWGVADGPKSLARTLMKGSPWAYRFVKMRSSSLRPPNAVLSVAGVPVEKAARSTLQSVATASAQIHDRR